MTTQEIPEQHSLLDFSGNAARVHKPAFKQTCVVILGMHRSGTSALTRVLNLLGAGLPKVVMGANHGNDTGHWEPARLVNLHEQMFAEAGTSWDDFRKFETSALSPQRLSQFVAAIAQVFAEEYGDAPLVVLKDPRICKFTPLYIAALESMGCELKFLHVTRNPLSVAASLEGRDGKPAAYVKLLWLRHALDAEAASRRRWRVFVSYESLMADWRPVVARLYDGLGLDWRSNADSAAQDAVDQFLNRAHTHYDADKAALMSDPCRWLATSHHLLTLLEADPYSARAMDELDAVREDFDHAARNMAGALLSVVNRRVDALSSENAALRRAIDGLKGQISYNTPLRAIGGA